MLFESHGLRTDRRVLPELLAPAGSPEALEAAITAGADAVYLGGSRFNARMNAHNFDPAALREAVTHAHRMGGRVYLTLNTLVWDRELSDALEAAYEAAEAGVDALIVADLGAAALIRRSLPCLPLHASTQLSGHNAAVGSVLERLGFSRFVIARETALSDLAYAVRSNPLEVEVFIHGALCVSHSGQCLFSSVVGGRSGNRGECAQPCRLPYGCGGCADQGRRDRGKPTAPRRNTPDRRSPDPESENYPLSLKDLSLAAHVPALIEAGVSSLKIEGRMKSPGYVSGVTAIWRRLLDENRAATPDEMAALGDLFSRGGFTDGYQVGRVNRSMMGVRSEADKERTAAAEKAALREKHPPRLPLTLEFTAAAGVPVTLTASAPLFRCQNTTRPVSVTVTGDIPLTAETVSLTAEAAEKQLSRTGGTPYTPVSVIARVEDGLMLPLSALNALRREALEALDATRMAAMPKPAQGYTPVSPAIPAVPAVPLRTAAPTVIAHEPAETPGAPPAEGLCRTARFYDPAAITKTAAEYFHILYLPVGKSHPAAVPPEKRGILLPPVIFDREAEAVRMTLTAALAEGIRHVTVCNLGHLPLISAAAEACGLSLHDLRLHGDLRLNIANTPAAARALSLGLTDVLLSPELTAPRLRDISRALTHEGRPAAAGCVVYGRLPLMLLEKCAIREIYRHQKPDAVCREICARNAAVLRDRMGKEFPVLREDSPAGNGHRNLVCNSLPTGMSDRPDELARLGMGHHHFIFTVESPREVDGVIAAYRDGRPLGCEVRRFPK